MNKLYESVAKTGFVIIALLGVHYITDWWSHLFFAVLALILVDFANRYSRKYTWLQAFQKIIPNYSKYQMKINLKKAIEEEEEKKYWKELIDNALIKVKSSNESERKLGLEQLSQYGEGYAHGKLLEILKNNEFDKSDETKIVETLCKILKNTEMFNCLDPHNP